MDDTREGIAYQEVGVLLPGFRMGSCCQQAPLCVNADQRVCCLLVGSQRFALEPDLGPGRGRRVGRTRRPASRASPGQFAQSSNSTCLQSRGASGGEHVYSGRERCADDDPVHAFRRPAFPCPKPRRMLCPKWNDRQPSKTAPQRLRNPHGNDSDKLLPRESGCTCLTSIRGGVQPFRRGRAPLPSETARSAVPLMYEQMTMEALLLPFLKASPVNEEMICFGGPASSRSVSSSCFS